MMAGNAIPKWHAVNAVSTRKHLAPAEHFYKNGMARFCSFSPPLLPPFALQILGMGTLMQQHCALCWGHCGFTAQSLPLLFY